MIRRLFLVLAIALGGLTISASPASAAKTTYYCLIDQNVKSATSSKSYRDACLKHLRNAGWRGLTITGWERCTKKDSCLHGLRQVHITATRKAPDGSTEELHFTAVTSYARK